MSWSSELRLPWLRDGSDAWARPTYRAALDDFRRQRLRDLVWHAATRVPYYRARFAAAGVDPSSIRDCKDLERIP